MKKVVKFGGSSLANAEQFEKVGDIIRSEESRRFVVPSAPGKRFDGDTKVTDLLYGCYDAAGNDGDFEKIMGDFTMQFYRNSYEAQKMFKEAYKRLMEITEKDSEENGQYGNGIE